MTTATASSSSAAASTELQEVRMLRAGKWESSTSRRWGEVFNPSTGRAIARVPMCTTEEVDRVVRGAAEALPKWAEMPVVERARVMFRFRDLILKNFERL